MTGAIAFHRIPNRFLDALLVARTQHVDEIHDDQSAQVAQPQLEGDLLGGLDVGYRHDLFQITLPF